jgi:hypothetical protein
VFNESATMHPEVEASRHRLCRLIRERPYLASAHVILRATTTFLIEMIEGGLGVPGWADGGLVSAAMR